MDDQPPLPGQVTAIRGGEYVTEERAPVSPDFMAALEDSDDELLLMEPRSSYDACIVGVAQRFNSRFIVYDRECVMEVLRADMEPDPSADPDPDSDPDTEAEEYFSFNVIGAWVGEGTPAYLSTRVEDLWPA